MTRFETSKQPKVDPERYRELTRGHLVGNALTGLGLSLAEELIRPIDGVDATPAPEAVVPEAPDASVTSLGHGAMHNLDADVARAAAEAARAA